MSAAASKRTALVAVSVALIAILAAAGETSGARDAKRDGGGRDREAPALADVRVTSATATTVALSWEPARDEVGVKRYAVYVNGRRVRNSGTTYTARGLRCGETVAVRIVAFDRAGNGAARSETIAATAPCADTRSPTSPARLRQAATAQDAVVLAWDAATDDVGVVSYGVYSSGLQVAWSVEPTVTLSKLPCGSTDEYTVDAVDAAGNHSLSSAVWLTTADCPDEEPPSTPTDLKLTDRTTSSLSLEWSPSSDDVRVAGYHVSLDDASVSTRRSANVREVTVTQPHATISDLACGRAYAIAVEAYDRAGNRSPAATFAASTEECPRAPEPPAPPEDKPPPSAVDKTPPSTPSGLAIQASTPTSISLTWMASTDDVGVEGYHFYVNRERVQTAVNPGATASALACGTVYTLGVAAFDAAGNRSPMAAVSAATEVCGGPAPPPPASDTTPPDPPSGLTVLASTQTSLSLTWAASSDDVGVAGYTVYVNGSRVRDRSEPGSTVTGLSCGTAYILGLDAYDAAGNRSSRAEVVATTAACTDNQPPSAPTSVQATLRTTTSIALSWTASSDNVGVAGYGLYRGGALIGSTTGTTAIFSNLVCNTSYTLSVDAFDAAGNRSAKATTLVATTACPDTTPPSAPANLVVKSASPTGLTLSWTASNDNVGVAGYNVYLNGAPAGTTAATGFTMGGLTCATSYTVGVEAYDAAGNRSARQSATATTSACSPPPSPSPPTVACHRYASRTGSDSNAGTATSPFKTVQRLADVLGAGETGCLRAGTYDETSNGYVLRVGRGGAAGAPITVRSYPGERAKLVGIVYVPNGSNNVTLSNLDIEGTGGQNTILVLSADVVIEDNDITNAQRGKSCMILGVQGYGRAIRTIIRRNRIHHCGSLAPDQAHLDHGIYAGLADDAQITGNAFWSSSGFTIQLYPDAQRTLVSGNVMDGDSPSVEGGLIFGGEGSLASKDNIVEKNVIAYATSYNIEYYWGGAVGSGNVARKNCLWAGKQGNITSPSGFTASENIVADPLFRDRANRDYRLQPGSCLTLLGFDPAAALR